MPSDADKAAYRAGPVLAPIGEMGLLAFDGADALGFLQGQLTIDIAGLAQDHWQTGGYCTPKGRLLAIFDCWRQGAAVGMLLPGEIAPAIRRRLTMFVLRSKVTIRDLTPQWRVLGILGAGAADALAAAGIDVPAQAGEVRTLEFDERLVRLSNGQNCPERLLLLVQAEREAHWHATLSGLAQVGSDLWWWAQVDAAVPTIVNATQELFVPQAVNLEVLGGVNFRKGCYPGQEVVARSQYLGKLRRRMFLAHGATVGSGPDVYQDGTIEPVGRIVMAAGAPSGGWDVLFECPTDRTAGNSLHAGSADAAPLQVRALPYALFDPTA
jgi:folate-binding protein YgfZ